MSPAWLLLALAAAPAVKGSAPDAPRRSEPAPLAPPHAPVKDAGRCEACHTVESWSKVTFAHERTGFELKASHAAAPCKGCHAGGYTEQVPTRCGDCHRDAHAGQLGRACDGCHDERGWQGAYSPDLHRRTNFPLTGRHAAVSCRECHPVAKDATFSRPTSDCVDCHAADYARADLGGTGHTSLGFGQACRMCHDTWRFRGARFAAHDACFPLSSGGHAGAACLSCHTRLPPGAAGGGCATGTAACTRCHGKAKTDAQHPANPGYRYLDGDCTLCHRARAP